ncbi:putative ribonuclease H-like domain-containing protein [Tanacetum coccineum]
MKIVPGKDYILLPLWPADLLFSQNLKSSPDTVFKPSRDDEKKVTEEPRKEGGDSSKDVESNDQEKNDNVNSTNNVNATSTNEVNVIGAKTSIKLPDDPNMPELEDIIYSADDDVGAKADMNNLNTFITMDVKSAFLYGKIEEEIYVCQPPGFEDPNFPDRVYKVEKRGKIDKTLFIRRNKDDILLVQVYVDDIIFGFTKKSLCTEFEKMMHKKFQMSSMGELTFSLGLQVKQKEDGIFISQDKYVTEILKKFGFTDVKTASTPMETQKPLLKDEDCEEVDVHLYRLMIGSLMYLTSLRPDIMFAVSACARYQVNPKASHLHAAKRTFRYLKGQPKLGLWYPKDSPFDLVAYTDSDYAGASLDRKSTTGEAEYVAASSCRGQVLWTQNQLLDYGDSNEKKLIKMTKIHTDKNVVDLLTKAFDLQALVDGKKIVVTEASVRRDLQLDEEEGTDCLPNATIFEELTRMGQGKDFSGRETPLFPIMMVQAQEEIGEGSAMPTDPHHTPIINQPSSSQPQRKQKSRRSKRKDTRVL